jgi:hypothetical protein
MSDQDGGPAFPSADGGSEYATYYGMSLRDWFAGRVLEGLYSNADVELGMQAMKDHAYRQADVMLQGRQEA